MPPIHFTTDELRELQRLISQAEGRFGDAFYSASEKIDAALSQPLTIFAPAEASAARGGETPE